MRPEDPQLAVTKNSKAAFSVFSQESKYQKSTESKLQLLRGNRDQIIKYLLDMQSPSLSTHMQLEGQRLLCPPMIQPSYSTVQEDGHVRRPGIMIWTIRERVRDLDRIEWEYAGGLAMVPGLCELIGTRCTSWCENQQTKRTFQTTWTCIWQRTTGKRSE